MEPQNVPSDAPKAVDCHPDSHCRLKKFRCGGSVSPAAEGQGRRARGFRGPGDRAAAAQKGKGFINLDPPKTCRRNGRRLSPSAQDDPQAVARTGGCRTPAGAPWVRGPVRGRARGLERGAMGGRPGRVKGRAFRWSQIRHGPPQSVSRGGRWGGPTLVEGLPSRRSAEERAQPPTTAASFFSARGQPELCGVDARSVSSRRGNDFGLGPRPESSAPSPHRILALVFGRMWPRGTPPRVRRSPPSGGGLRRKRIAAGRATYAAWDRRTRLAVFRARRRPNACGSGQEGSDASHLGLGGTIPDLQSRWAAVCPDPRVRSGTAPFRIDKAPGIKISKRTAQPRRSRI